MKETIIKVKGMMCGGCENRIKNTYSNEPKYEIMVLSTYEEKGVTCKEGSILKGYKELNYNDIIVTKLDETSVYGALYNIEKLSNKPIRYITTGQNVPDDIEEFNSQIPIEAMLNYLDVYPLLLPARYSDRTA